MDPPQVTLFLHWRTPVVIDILIVLFILSAMIRGREIGLVQQFFSTLGFFGGLFLGAQLQKFTVELVSGEMTRTFVTLLTTLGTALVFLMLGELTGMILKRRFVRQRFNRVDSYLGSVVSMVSVVLAVWLSAAIVRGLPYPGLQQAFQQSKIVNSVSKNLPYAPDVIASIGHLVNPNGFPQVFAGWEGSQPPEQINLPSSSELAAAVEKDRDSVVKIVGEGCGGIVDGSGFVAANDLVITNAHVVAGINRQYVVDENGTHSARAIWFDPELDLAILQVDNLAGGPINIDTSPVDPGTAAAILGYPGGGAFTANPASILDQFTATGRDIYNRGTSERSVYEIGGDVEQGNSGGPLVTADGDVVGVIFARSTAYDQIGYALTADQVANALNQASARSQLVDTGSCTR